MARPVVSPLSEELYEALGFHREDDEELDFPLLKFWSPVLLPLDPVYELAAEGDDSEAPWSLLFDVDNAPASVLPCLAQFVGCVLTPEMGEEQMRSEIGQPTGWKRGWRESIRTVAKRGLTGSKRVILRPRTPEVGHYFARTLLSETPDPVRVERDLRRAVAAWSLLDYEALDGVSWADVEASWEDWGAVAAAFDSWADLADILPDELPEP